MDATDEGVSTKFDRDYEALVKRREAEAEEPVEEDFVEEEPEEPFVELVSGDNVYKVPASAKYKAKIDGEEVDVPFDQITRNYQKGAAADKRLEEAALRMKRLEEKESELTRREQEFVNQQQALEQQREKGSITNDAYREKAKKLLAALTDEDESDPEGRIAAVLSELTDPEDIIRKAESRALSKVEELERKRELQSVEAERIKANKRFEEEFADVVTDPIAYMAARKLAEEKWNARPNAMPWEIASEVGNEIRNMRVVVQKKPTTLKTVSARSAIGADEKPQTREDIINQMRKARGQP